MLNKDYIYYSFNLSHPIALKESCHVALQNCDGGLGRVWGTPPSPTAESFLMDYFEIAEGQVIRWRRSLYLVIY